MEQPNWWILVICAFIPLVTGAIWYNPAVFGKAWLSNAGITIEHARAGNKLKIFGFTYLFSLFAAYMLALFSVHQSSIIQLFLGDPALLDSTSAISQFVNEALTTYGDRHRTFSHGIIHGLELGLMLGLPMIGIHSLFERRSFKYILIHVGYWMITFAIMGAIICVYF